MIFLTIAGYILSNTKMKFLLTFFVFMLLLKINFMPLLKCSNVTMVLNILILSFGIFSALLASIFIFHVHTLHNRMEKLNTLIALLEI
jgi:hypothetical protein